MKKDMTSKGWAKEFDSFMNCTEIQPPRDVTEKIVSVVQRELNPPFWNIFSKLAAIHVVVGSLSLTVCSQFGMGTGEMLFMSFGVVICTAFCGSLFLGASTLVAGFLLSRDEHRNLRRTGYAPVLTLGVFSLAIFLFFGADIVLGLAIAWLVGAYVAAIIFAELAFAIRKFTAY